MFEGLLIFSVPLFKCQGGFNIFQVSLHNCLLYSIGSLNTKFHRNRIIIKEFSKEVFSVKEVLLSFEF